MQVIEDAAQYGGNLRALIETMWPKEGISTLLDLGCGKMQWSLGLPGVEQHTGIDVWQPVIDETREIVKTHSLIPVKLLCMDVREFLITRAEASYDAVIALDLVEHFEEDEAKFMIGQVSRVAKHLAIVWTTLGYIYQAGVDPDGTPNPHQEHHYGPTEEDFDGWEGMVFPTWHQDRGGGIFAYKHIEPIQDINPLAPTEIPWV
jgi:hypothetical protein